MLTIFEIAARTESIQYPHYLNLSSAQIDVKKITVLSRDISSRAISITNLDLSYNKDITDKSCRALGNIFSSKSSVKYLNLDGTSIS